MKDRSQEWLKQADFDMDTAEFMFKGGRYFYAVFMCHLSLEKALKGLLYKRTSEVPPKVHNLIYLANKTGIPMPEPIGQFIVKLNQANIATRYPESLDILQKEYTNAVAEEIIIKSKEALTWIKRQL